MKRKTKKKLFIFIILAILLFSVYFLINFLTKEKEPPTVEPEETSYLNKLNSNVSLDEGLKSVIVEYMDLYYKSMKELKEYDMSYLFVDPTGEQAKINQTAVSLLTEIRKLKPNDLSLSKAKYDLDIKDIKQEGELVTLSVLESNYLHFSFMSEIESRVYNIENEFTLKKVNDQYKIVEYDKIQDFFVMITEKYESGKELEKIKKDYIDTVKGIVEKDKEDYQDYLNKTGIKKRTCDNPYDRSKALEHALAWVNKRDNDWIEFDSNCQNFASQVLYSGGIPFDYTGRADEYMQWKGYDQAYNEDETASGYVYTWTYVPYFYQYAKKNTGYGLCASVDVNMYYAEAGDVIHVGTTGPTRHALVVIDTYKKDNKVVDIIVNSNTVDLDNYPLSAYLYPYVSLIKIYGWNN